MESSTLLYFVFQNQECLKFLKEINLDAGEDVSANPFQHASAVANLFSETSSTFLKVLLLHLN